MKRFLQYWLLPAAVFLLLFGSTVFLLPVLINVQKILPFIEQQLSKTTGRTVTIGSDFGISLLPSPTVSFSDFEMSNASGFSEAPFLKVDSFEARLRLLPLLRKEIQFSRFIVNGLEMNLERSVTGKRNWIFPRISGQHFSFMENASVSLLGLTNGRIVFDNKEQKKQWLAEELILLGKQSSSGDPIFVEMKGVLNNHEFSLDGNMGPFSFHDIAGKTALSAPKKGLALPMDMDMSLIDVFHGHLKGSLNLREQSPQFDIQVSIDDFPLSLFLDGYNVAKGGGHEKIMYPAPANIGVRVIKDEGRGVRFTEGTVMVGDSHLNFSGKYRSIDLPSVDLDLNFAKFALKDLWQDSKGSFGGSISAEAFLQRVPSLQQVIYRGRITGEKLAVKNGLLDNINASFLIEGGNSLLELHSASLYGGSLRGKLKGGQENSDLFSRMSLVFSVVEGGALVSGFLGKELLRGKISGDMMVSSNWENNSPLPAIIGGSGEVTIHDGALRGVDFWRIFHPDIEGLSEEPNENSSSSVLETVFGTLSMHFEVTGDKISFQKGQIEWKGKTLNLTGNGELREKSFEVHVTGMKPAAQEAATPVKGNYRGGVLAIELPHIKEISISPLRQLPSESEVENLVNGQLPSPSEEDVNDLVGKSLIDPHIVAQRFRLRPEIIVKDKFKNRFPVTETRLRIHPIRIEQ